MPRKQAPCLLFLVIMLVSLGVKQALTQTIPASRSPHHLGLTGGSLMRLLKRTVDPEIFASSRNLSGDDGNSLGTPASSVIL